MTQVTIESIVTRWSDPDARPLFKGELIDDSGCCCAQGDVLRVCGWKDSMLRALDQLQADREVAAALGISLAHSVLLRVVNDREGGCPQDVLAYPEKILGGQAGRVLVFWRRLDAFTPQQWAAAAEVAREVAREAAGAAAREAAREAAGEAAGAAAAEAAWAAGGAAAREAARATNEIQGAAKLDRFFFLPMFGIRHPSELDPGGK